MEHGLSEAELLDLVQAEFGDDTPEVTEDIEFTAADFAGLRLRNDNVAIKLRPRADLSDGGIALARPRKVPCSSCTRKGNAKCKLCKGSMQMPNPHLEPLVEADVLAVGPGYHTAGGAFVPLEVAVGDVVLVREDAGDKFRYSHDVRIVRAGHLWEGGEYLQGEIHGVVEA